MIATLRKNIRNIRGIRIQDKILVLESDDWGSERAQGKHTIEGLKNLGYQPEKCVMTMTDCLESDTDLQELYNVLLSHKDSRGKLAVLTPFFNLTNPDYEIIKANKYHSYSYLDVLETAKKYSDHDNLNKLYHNGINQGIFIPEYHGREHLHAQRWLRLLRDGNEHFTNGFDLEYNGFSKSYAPGNYKNVRAAYDLDNDEDLDFMLQSISEGISEFENLFGFKPLSFAPPNGPYPRFGGFEEVMQEMGVKVLGGPGMQQVPDGKGKITRKHFYTGLKHRLGFIYLLRNGIFEPSMPTRNWVDYCMEDIQMAFRWKKPAIISTHRNNFTGTINPANRENGLKQLDELLTRVKKKWPDVQFMSTRELYATVEKKSIKEVMPNA